jgi:hypothetical protein
VFNPALPGVEAEGASRAIGQRPLGWPWWAGAAPTKHLSRLG